jgi:hypothetical protein
VSVVCSPSGLLISGSKVRVIDGSHATMPGQVEEAGGVERATAGEELDAIVCEVDRCGRMLARVREWALSNPTSPCARFVPQRAPEKHNAPQSCVVKASGFLCFAVARCSPLRVREDFESEGRRFDPCQAHQLCRWVTWDGLAGRELALREPYGLRRRT